MGSWTSILVWRKQSDAQRTVDKVLLLHLAYDTWPRCSGDRHDHMSRPIYDLENKTEHSRGEAL